MPKKYYLKALFVMKQLLYVFIFIPFMCGAQEAQGIKFETTLRSWKDVLMRAKAENKYIFIDCFTTWCGPCKVMDNQVYTSKEVGNFFNVKFLSLKVQMDRTEKDDQYTMGWYGDAEFIQKNFNVFAFPTFIFLAPDGSPLHKASGLLNPQQFIALGKDAQNPKKQFYKMLADFKPGVMDTSEMKGIARALRFSGSELAKKIAEDYLNRIPASILNTPDNLKFLKEFKETDKAMAIALKYIKELPEAKLFTRDNIEFVGEFIRNTKSLPFKIFYENSEKINAKMNDKDYVQNTITPTIMREMFFIPLGIPARDTVRKGGIVHQPDWGSLLATISTRFNSYYADRITMDAKVWWYSMTKNWEEYSKAQIKKIDATYTKKDLNDPGVCWNLNNDCWYTFEKATDTAILKRLAYWMEESFRHDLAGATFYTYMDTYANILYKLGKREIALVWQERAAKLRPEDPEIVGNLNKMKNNEPTWSVTSK
ncbi:hypothetical protein A4R26_32660 [Niastella populi]|uniref:Spermatogenesis-associated protein 20-like TRX domain-containing protein n=2 Tax=Niastella populi TaxID=550983 RepID=A0A1V9GB25_9BACT|nr:hypothetical protein A4R26_32660 [Niastella populi]